MREPDEDGTDDWTLDLPQTDHVRFFRETNWAMSALGPLKQWDSTLRMFVRMLHADSRAACIWWGDSYTAIYNEHYAPLAASAHPRLMGAHFSEGYPELWESIKPYFDTAKATGRGKEYSPTAALIVERKGWREEAFFDGNFIPIGSGSSWGFYNTVNEVTALRLADRRTMLLNRLASLSQFELDEGCNRILETLATDPEDIPLAMLYELGEGAMDTMRLRGQYGLPKGHNLLVESCTPDSHEGLIPECRLAAAELLTIDYDDRFDSVSWAGFGSPSKKIAILPITSGSRIFGYLIVGTNPHRPFDEPCQQFLRDLMRMVSSIISTAVGAREIKMRQRQLENDLAMSDYKLRHLIEHASVGMSHTSLDGHILWANHHYYALSGHSAKAPAQPFSFFEAYLDEDRPKAEEAWATIVSTRTYITTELRLKRLYTTPIGDPEPAQLQVLAFPYIEEGVVNSVMVCTTDISRLKWAQNFQARLAAEAREAKRQQEAFIDVVSHEMRNPLSAIVHCADAIVSAIEECRTQNPIVPEAFLDTLEENLASANVIMQCANHQKRIIDDVLTLSKLDSMLLSITPSVVRPAELIHSIVNLFEAELKSKKIQCNVNPDPSLAKYCVEQVYVDPSRVMQIFINLLTNAIKFVKDSSQPSISVRFGATMHNPRNFFSPKTFWAPKNKHHGDVTSNPEWGAGEELFLAFSVQDTGIGLREKEIHKIFERFRQATLKTHSKYGGTGLGLFISKELTEKQGGEIGVSSIVGGGSTFVFYVKARRFTSSREDSVPTLVGEASHGTEHRGAISPDQDPHQLQVLLVEDNLINQQVLGKQLKKAGCVVDVANHGLEALDMVGKKIFDIVLMDLEMPVLNGLAAMQEIRKRESEGEGILGEALKEGGRQGGSRLPIIAVTANVRRAQIDNAIAAGADRVMQKPFKAADLLMMMKGLVPQLPTSVPVLGPSETLALRPKENEDSIPTP